MATSTFAIERGADVGDVLAAAEVLLDDLEARGELGSGSQLTRLREQVMQLARIRGALWVQEPDAAAVDLFAYTLALPELAATRARWTAELDARGPWLRPLRPRTIDPVVMAERLLEPGPDTLIGLRFEGEDEVVFEHRDDAGVLVWSWRRARVEHRPEHERRSAPGRREREVDPRFVREGDVLRFRASPSALLHTLPWPELGHADAKLSIDGRRVLVFGWYDEGVGLVRVLDAASLAILDTLQFRRPVSEVIERPGSDELLVRTHDELHVFDARSTKWTHACKAAHVAWSPSGRYVCAVAGSTQILDTHAESIHEVGAGLPPAFSPDGERLVDGCELLEGRTGASVATLDIRLGEYLMGGPPRPWYHVGSELIVCLHGGLALWDTRTGAAVPLQSPLRVRSIERVAYSPDGRWLAHGFGDIVIDELPTLERIATLAFGYRVEALAFSGDGERLAAYGAGRLEVRTWRGELVCHGETPMPREASIPLVHNQLSFGADDRTIHLSEPGWSNEGRTTFEGAWLLEGAQARWIDTPAERGLPPGWDVDAGPFSRFRHEQGSTITVASAGPWAVHPTNPRLLACPGQLYELRDYSSTMPSL